MLISDLINNECLAKVTVLCFSSQSSVLLAGSLFSPMTELLSSELSDKMISLWDAF